MGRRSWELEGGWVRSADGGGRSVSLHIWRFDRRPPRCKFRAGTSGFTPTYPGKTRCSWPWCQMDRWDLHSKVKRSAVEGNQCKSACEDRPHMSGEKPMLSIGTCVRRGSCSTNCGEEGQGFRQPVCTRRNMRKRKNNYKMARGALCIPQKTRRPTKASRSREPNLRCSCGRRALGQTCRRSETAREASQSSYVFMSTGDK